MLAMQFENPMVIFKTVVIGFPSGNECRKANLFRATGCGDDIVL